MPPKRTQTPTASEPSAAGTGSARRGTRGRTGRKFKGLLRRHPDGRDPRSTKWVRRVKMWERQVTHFMPTQKASLRLYEALKVEAEDEAQRLDLNQGDNPTKSVTTMTLNKDGFDGVSDASVALYSENGVLPMDVTSGRLCH